MTIRNVTKSEGILLLVLATALVPLWSGCGGKDRLAVYPVRGRVVFQDRGLSDAMVVFQPADKSSEAAAENLRPSAETDAEGRFGLKTYITGDGAPQGEYEVIVIIPSTAGQVAVDREGPNPFEKVAETAGGNSIPRALRQKYAKADTSGITVTVKPGENELEPFVLQ